jgi:hypothetical protein
MAGAGAGYCASIDGSIACVWPEFGLREAECGVAHLYLARQKTLSSAKCLRQLFLLSSSRAMLDCVCIQTHSFDSCISLLLTPSNVREHRWLSKRPQRHSKACAHKRKRTNAPGVDVESETNLHQASIPRHVGAASVVRAAPGRGGRRAAAAPSFRQRLVAGGLTVWQPRRKSPTLANVTQYKVCASRSAKKKNARRRSAKKQKQTGGGVITDRGNKCPAAGCS